MSLALAQQEGFPEQDDLICQSIGDTKEIVRRLKDYEILKEVDLLNTQRIRLLESEIELLKKEIEIKDQMLKIKDMTIALQDRTIQDLRDLNERALKLAEVSQKKTSLQGLGIIGLIAFLLGIAIAH